MRSQPFSQASALKLKMAVLIARSLGVTRILDETWKAQFAVKNMKRSLV